jgi:hypothetical protein
MKKKRNQKLLVSTAAIAGVVLGAGLAFGAHPEVQLFTYEELAMQFGYPKMPVMVDANGKGFPYSPKQTCGTAGCHIKNGKDYTYDDISNKAFHSAQGRNEIIEFSGGKFPTTRNKPWTTSPGMVGKW